MFTYNFTDLATVYITFYLIHYTIPNMTGKIANNALEIRVYMKGSYLLGSKPGYIHR